MLFRHAARASTGALSGPARVQRLACAPATTGTCTHLQPLIAFRNAYAAPSISSKCYETSRSFTNKPRNTKPFSWWDLPPHGYPIPGAPTLEDVLIKNITLWAPWQVVDLAAVEQEAYATHGPDYVRHLGPIEALSAVRHAKGRLASEARFRTKLGDEHWYRAITLGRDRWAEIERKVFHDLAARELEMLKETDEKTRQSLNEEILKDRRSWSEERGPRKELVYLELMRELQAGVVS